MQVLYQLEQNVGVNSDELRRFVERRLRDENVREYAEILIAGVRDNLAELDGLISQAAENWRIDRMAAIDRNILRIGAFEIAHRTEIPRRVAINEALELAKRTAPLIPAGSSTAFSTASGFPAKLARRLDPPGPQRERIVTGLRHTQAYKSRADGFDSKPAAIRQPEVGKAATASAGTG